ncbi:hypothetical protein BM1_04796 [Bipolaris maydis]|nr:hypothetical protein BM1_04796 [Bipolaris maydis]
MRDSGYNRTMAQTNKVPTIKADPESAAVSDSSAMDSGKTHAKPSPEFSENRNIKQEYSRLVDDLDMA